MKAFLALIKREYLEHKAAAVWPLLQKMLQQALASLARLTP